MQPHLTANTSVPPGRIDSALSERKGCLPRGHRATSAAAALALHWQRGGTFLGLVIGVVLGLGAALGVAIYVSKVPVPFLSRYQARNPALDAAEAQKNRDWDPNSAFAGKRGGKAADGNTAPTGNGATTVAPVTAPATDSGAAAQSNAAAPAPAYGSKTQSADPLGDLARARSGTPAAGGGASVTASATPATVVPPAPTADPFSYFVQVGAFRTNADADAQRARLAIMGWEARVTEREQSGRTVFRVRVGPFTRRDDADELKQKLDVAGMESSLVRAQR